MRFIAGVIILLIGGVLSINGVGIPMFLIGLWLIVTSFKGDSDDD